MSDKNPNNIEVTISTILNTIINHNYVLPACDYIIKCKDIDLVPSNANLFTLESKLSTVTFREYILKKFIDDIRDDYDYIIIDCMPQIGIPMINVMIATDSLIIPTQAEILSVKGLAKLIKYYLMIKDANKNLKIDGILITMDSKNTKVKKFLNEKFKESISLFNTIIPKSIKVSEANIYKQTICEYLPQNTVSKAYESFLQEVLKIE